MCIVFVISICSCYRTMLIAIQEIFSEFLVFYNLFQEPFKRAKYRGSYPEMFCRKGAFRNFIKFTGKHLCQSLFFNKCAGLRYSWCRCFPVNFAKFVRTPFFTEHLRWLFLQIIARYEKR